LFGLAWRGVVWDGLVWGGLIWFGLAWSGLFWYDLIPSVVSNNNSKSGCMFTKTKQM
jgi:hypothetical protein